MWLKGDCVTKGSRINKVMSLETKHKKIRPQQQQGCGSTPDGMLLGRKSLHQSELLIIINYNSSSEWGFVSRGVTDPPRGSAVEKP